MRCTDNNVPQDANARDIAKHITDMHNELSLLDISRMEHYIRCQKNGNVPVACLGGWCHDGGVLAMILLYLRLPENVKPFVVRPEGLRAYRESKKKLNKRSKKDV